jgi:CheY-like chemotaxis protein
MASTSGIVMVVDDEAPLRSVVSRALTNAGHMVVAAADGHEAIGLMPLYDVDLVLCDISMPTMSGYEVLRRIRAAWPETQVVFMTGSYEDVTEIIESGADAVIPKPFELTQLVRQVGRLIDRHRMAVEAVEARRVA